MREWLLSAVEFSIVLPAHNEAGNIAPIIAELKRLMSPLGRTEIIGVDDGSNDGTLEACAPRPPPIRWSATSRSPAISATRQRCAPGCALRAARR